MRMTRSGSAMPPPASSSDLEGLSAAVWGFLEGAYRKGVLDEALGLAGGFMDPAADLGQALGDFEDALSQADFGPLEKWSAELLTPLLQVLSREEVLENLGVLLRQVQSLLTRVPPAASKRNARSQAPPRLGAGAVPATGGEARALAAMVREAGTTLAALGSLARALLPVLTKFYHPAAGEFLEKRAGPLVSEVLNAASKAASAHPEAVSRFISRVFAGLDGRAFRAAADVIAEAVLDERPPLAQWTAATVTKRVRKRVQTRRGGSHGGD